MCFRAVTFGSRRNSAPPSLTTARFPSQPSPSERFGILEWNGSFPSILGSFKNASEKLNRHSSEKNRPFGDALLRDQENHTIMEALRIPNTRHDARSHILRRHQCWSRHDWETSSRRSTRQHSRRHLTQSSLGWNIGSPHIVRERRPESSRGQRSGYRRTRGKRNRTVLSIQQLNSIH